MHFHRLNSHSWYIVNKNIAVQEHNIVSLWHLAGKLLQHAVDSWDFWGVRAKNGTLIFHPTLQHLWNSTDRLGTCKKPGMHLCSDIQCCTAFLFNEPSVPVPSRFMWAYTVGSKLLAPLITFEKKENSTVVTVSYGLYMLNHMPSLPYIFYATALLFYYFPNWSVVIQNYI